MPHPSREYAQILQKKAADEEKKKTNQQILRRENTHMCSMCVLVSIFLFQHKRLIEDDQKKEKKEEIDKWQPKSVECLDTWVDIKWMCGCIELVCCEMEHFFCVSGHLLFIYSASQREEKKTNTKYLKQSREER